MGRVIERHGGQPAAVLLRPIAAVGEDSVVAQEKALELLARPALALHRSGTCAREVAHRFMRFVGHPDGGQFEEIAEAPEWQPQTVRGAIAGALKKKLGLDITSEKDEERRRVYRVSE